MSWKRHRLSSQREERRFNHNRVTWLALFFIIFSVFIIWRLFVLQALRGGFYTALAAGQHELYKKLFPERGSIYVLEDANGEKTLFPLVTNREMDMLYVVPSQIKEPAKVAEQLFEILGLPENIDLAAEQKKLFADIAPTLDLKMAAEIKQARWDKWLEEKKQEEITRLTEILAKSNDPYEPIRHRLTPEQSAAVSALKVDGLALKKESWRYYPEKGMGGHIFGFVGFVGDKLAGQYGLEGYFEKELAGRVGEIQSEGDSWGNIIAIGNNHLQEKIDGSDLILTINRAIQYKACQAIKATVDRFKAVNGSIIVIDVKTGAILAMCGAPDYDPNEYYKVSDINVFNNPAIFNTYEPGSVFKSITMAAALDSGSVEPQTTYEDTGEVRIGPDVIRNFNDLTYGQQTMTQVLEKSINTGAIWAMRKTTPSVFATYVRNFGFGEKTGITFTEEAAGDLSNLNRRGEVYPATASFGQGITINSLQMAMAMAAIANNGKLMKPYIVSQIINNKKEVKSFTPQEVRQVISPEAAKMLSAMLVSVVDNGHGKPAAVNCYRVGGKTGTAQAAGANGRYTGEVDTSFVGFAPFANPRFALMVNINKPQWGKEAVVTAAPVFGDVAKFILQYYNVPCDR